MQHGKDDDDRWWISSLTLSSKYLPTNAFFTILLLKCLGVNYFFFFLFGILNAADFFFLFFLTHTRF